MDLTSLLCMNARHVCKHHTVLFCWWLGFLAWVLTSSELLVWSSVRWYQVNSKHTCVLQVRYLVTIIVIVP